MDRIFLPEWCWSGVESEMEVFRWAEKVWSISISIIISQGKRDVGYQSGEMGP
jgi:hypothetical protein